MGFAAVRQAPPFAAVPSSDVLAPPSSTAEILYAGRLSAEKGVDVLLDAFARVVAGRPDARLVVAGDGPDRQALLARAAHTSGVEFTGVLERPDLEARMGRARAVVVQDCHHSLCVGNRGVGRTTQIDNKGLVRFVERISIHQIGNRSGRYSRRESQSAARGHVIVIGDSVGRVGGGPSHRDGESARR